MKGVQLTELDAQGFQGCCPGMRATRSRAAAGPSKADQDNAHSPVQVAADPSAAAAAQTAALAQHAVASALPVAAAVTAQTAVAACAVTAVSRAAKLSRYVAEALLAV